MTSFSEKPCPSATTPPPLTVDRSRDQASAEKEARWGARSRGGDEFALEGGCRREQHSPASGRHTRLDDRGELPRPQTVRLRHDYDTAGAGAAAPAQPATAAVSMPVTDSNEAAAARPGAIAPTGPSRREASTPSASRAARRSPGR